MTEDKTSFGIMKTYDDKEEMLSYEVACSCGSPDCRAVIDYTIDEDGFFISMCFNKKLIWDYNSGINPWDKSSFFRKYILRPAKIFSARLKAALRLMFIGYIDVTGDIILREDQHIEGVIKGLTAAHEIMKERLENYKQKHKGKNCETR